MGCALKSDSRLPNWSRWFRGAGLWRIGSFDAGAKAIGSSGQLWLIARLDGLLLRWVVVDDQLPKNEQ